MGTNQTKSQLVKEEQQKQQTLIDKAIKSQSSQQYRQPNPIGDQKYPKENIFDFFVSQDKQTNVKIHTYLYPAQADKTPIALIIIFHGLNGHANNSAHIAHSLSELGCDVAAMDFRGFGKSEGHRGYIESVETHLKDSQEFVDQVTEQYKNIPVFLLGQSLGGMTAFQLALQEPQRFQGVILFAPAIMENQAVSYWGQLTMKGLGTVIPQLQTVPQSRGTSNKNPQITEDNNSDDLLYKDKVVAGTIKTVLNSMNESEKAFHLFESPFILFQGGIDKVIDPYVGFQLEQRCQSQDQKVYFNENMWHNIWCEPEIKEIIPMVVNWVKERV